MRGYQGIRTHLPPRPIADTATRPSQRYHRDQCTEQQWKRLQQLFHTFQQAGRVCRSLHHTVQGGGVDHPPTRTGQQTLHAFAASAQRGEQATTGTMRPTDRQSAADWSFHYRPAEVGEITFDVSTMTPTSACPPQGTWTATVRHGQATIAQHPRPRHGKKLKPSKTDITIDAAQLQGLLARGATLPAIAAACERQTDSSMPFSKALSAGLGLATGATTWWGATALTWDQHFQNFVSPAVEEEELGSLNFQQALGSIGENTIICIDDFREEQRKAIMLALQDTSATSWLMFSIKGRTATPTRKILSAISTHLDTLLPGQMGASTEESWRTGDTRVVKFPNSVMTSLWAGGKAEHLDDEAWTAAWTLHDRHTPPITQLSPAGQLYWRHRQDGAYVDWKGVLAACDGSVQATMGAGAILRSPTGVMETQVCRVGGDPSSFRAEASAMYQAVYNADRAVPLAILTDSMNVIQALQAWDHAEFLRDMTWQRNADILTQILLAINLQMSPITIVKVKSHRGCEMNEQADALADMAATLPAEGEEDCIDTMFVPGPPDSAITYQWIPDGEEEMMRTADHRIVLRRWDAVDRQITTQQERQKDTFACQLMTQEGWGQELWQQSRRGKQWTETEERRWLQMVGRVFPVNTYLRRIDKHPSGDCSWCGKGVQETLAHFQCGCPQFEKNRTAAHHLIARAVVASLKDLNLANWTFFYETEIKDLPFKFDWTSPAEERQQMTRRPDGVVWNPVLGKVIFLEFTRAMDNPKNMALACATKGRQYLVPMRAAQRANLLYTVSTSPMIFGVRGTVLMTEAAEGLKDLKLTGAQLKRVLASGVRAAITAASEMCSARFAALRSLPASPRGRDGKKIKTVIPQKPAIARPWRSDRGWTKTTVLSRSGEGRTPALSSITH